MSAASAGVSGEAARELLIDLVSTPSVSGDEAEAAERLVAFFEDHDRETWIDEVGNVRAPADDGLLLTSHIDTVPGEIPVRVEAAPDDAVVADPDREAGETDVLWGRGSVDATGPLAAMAAAAVDTGASFVGVVGEETDSRGAQHLVESREAPDAVINGEPSGTNGITLGYRGFLAGTYTATSASVHTSRPEPNAIQHALSWWHRVEARVAGIGGGESDAVFEQVTAKPVSIDGGTSDDGLSVDATMDVQLRIPPSTDAETLRDAAEAALDEDAGAPEAAGTLEWTSSIPPVMESPRTPVARALRAAIRGSGDEPRLVCKTGTSDMNIYAGAWECPMATYGPGDSALDHTPEERLSLAAFDRSITVLESTAERLLGEPEP